MSEGPNQRSAGVILRVALVPMKRLLIASLIVACIAAAVGVWQYRQLQQPSNTVETSQDEPKKADWLKQLYSQNPREVEAATEELRTLGERALPAIQETLRDQNSDADALKAALKACTILGRTAGPIVADVADVLPEQGLTAEAAVALSYMGPDAFPPLRAALSNSDPIVRRESLRSIGKLKERASLESELVVPLIIERMTDRDEGVRAVAATYLGIIHQGANEAVPALVAGLSDPDVEVRLASAAALGSFEPVAAAPALPALRKAARDRNPDVAREAGRTMVKLQGK